MTASVIQSSHIKFIYWDVGGVLSQDALGPKRKALAEKYGLDEQTLEKCHAKYRVLADYGAISDCEYWRFLLQDAGVANPTQEDCELDLYVRPVPGTMDIMAALKASGYGIGILSDDSVELAEKRAELLGYGSLVPSETFIISSYYFAKKPFPEIYDVAIGAAGVAPDEILFIDDRDPNIMGAIQMGMQGLLFQNADQLKQDLRAFGIDL